VSFTPDNRGLRTPHGGHYNWSKMA
jgi:hypothetical protein